MANHKGEILTGHIILLTIDIDDPLLLVQVQDQPVQLLHVDGLVLGLNGEQAVLGADRDRVEDLRSEHVVEGLVSDVLEFVLFELYLHLRLLLLFLDWV
jgi:hypothetical protein